MLQMLWTISSFVENEYEEIFEDIDMNDTFFFVVSKSNYVQLYKSKEAETYIDSLKKTT